jgi:hypothetical protein
MFIEKDDYNGEGYTHIDVEPFLQDEKESKMSFKQEDQFIHD